MISTLDLSQAKGHTDELLRALGHPAGARAYVTGAPAIQHDLDPIFNHDLQKGEAIALPIALLVLLAVFGLSLAVTIPLLFAACTVFGTLGIVYVAAHYMTTPTYVTNLVFLIGIGIAIDYSLLIVYRFREELGRGLEVEEAVLRTMETAGRAVIVSGFTVAIGLALLLFMPLPFMRAMGVGGFLIPIVSILAAATLQPALLAIYGRRGNASRPRRDLAATAGAADGRRRRAPVLGAPGALDHAAQVVVRGGDLRGAGRRERSRSGGSSSPRGRRPGSRSTRSRCRDSMRSRAPSGRARSRRRRCSSTAGGRAGRAPRRSRPRSRGCVGELARDPEVAAAYHADNGRFVDRTGRWAQVIVATRHEYGSEEAQDFARRLRSELIPAARFPESADVRAGGAPPQGVDFLDRAYGAFPWLVLGVLALTYLLLMRAFRSMVLPLKAVILNLLSVAAAYGALVLVFRFGLGEDAFGVYQFPQIEGWIPIFLFAMIFGLSMDYEVFLVSRMREAWDETQDNGRAVAIGLERTGRIITAAAIVMVAAFSGFMAGSIVGLQEFGCGLAVAIFLDATLVRGILVPALMAIMGRYNWWLPAPMARIVRVRPSPLVEVPPWPPRPV